MTIWRKICREISGSHRPFSYELTLEEWRLPNGEDLVEVSIKVPPKKAPQAQKEFDKHPREFGLDPKGAQEPKTRTALEYFAKTLKEAPNHNASPRRKARPCHPRRSS
jgi:hypothetical protein